MRRTTTTLLTTLPILTTLAIVSVPALGAGPWDKFKKKVNEVKEVKEVIDTISDSESEEANEKKTNESTKTSGESAETGAVSTGSGAISTVVIGSLEGIEKPSIGSGSFSSKDHLINAQGTKLMRLVAQGSRVRVVCDGVESDPYSSVQGMCFSPDGSSWGYVGLTSSKAHVVVNGEVRVELDLETQTLAMLPDDVLYTSSKQATQLMTQQKLQAQMILFSDDGSRFSCVVATPSGGYSNYGASHNGFTEGMGPYEVIVDGESIAEVPSIGMMRFTPGNRHIFTTGGKYAKAESSRAVYIDGVQGPEIVDASIMNIGFDERGEDLVYMTRSASSGSMDNTQVYINNVAKIDPSVVPAGATIHSVHTDPTLTTIGLVLESIGQGSGRTHTLWVNGEEAGALLNSDSFILGHDGNYVLHDPDRFIVVNGERQLDYTELQAACFSRNSDAYRYAVSTQLGVFIVDEKKNETGPTRDKVKMMRLSPDGARVAALTYGGLSVDGVEIVPANYVKYSKDIPIDDAWTTITLRNQQNVSDSIAQAAQGVGLRVIAVPNDQKHTATSEDGRYRAVLRQNYNAQTKERHYELHVNDRLVGGRFDQIGHTHFDDSGTLRFVATHGDTLMSCSYTP